MCSKKRRDVKGGNMELLKANEGGSVSKVCHCEASKKPWQSAWLPQWGSRQPEGLTERACMPVKRMKFYDIKYR